MAADPAGPGVWWLRGTRGSNVYLIECADGRLALVDTGFGSSSAAILRELGERGAGRELAAILLTHGHLDHCGAAREVAEATGALLVAGAGDCDADGETYWLRPHMGRTHPFRIRRRRPSSPVRVDIAAGRELEVLPGIVAVPAPGHTPGSLCFVAKHLGAAFVGDLVISHGGELTRPLRVSNHDDRQYLATLSSFAAEAPAAGYPGHGEPVLSGFGDALRTLAALPRRRPGPGAQLQRLRRLARFSAGMARRRS
jgi:glyoxylase-like metal-dependent hydrolase (beta-lactamase superfamily II)